MIKHYFQILFVFSSMGFLAGCDTVREVSNDFSTAINGPAPMRQTQRPAREQNQKETNSNTNAATPATGTTTNKTTNIDSKTNIIPVISQPVNVKPAPTPTAPTVNEDQNNSDEPEVRSTPNTE